MESTRIRKAEPTDADQICEIAFQSKSSHGYSPEFMEACQKELTYTKDQIRSDRFHFVVAEEEGALVGFTALEILSDTECSIEAMFVTPSCTGRGIGSRLFHSVLEWASRHRITGVHIQSDPSATSFYKAFGAQLVGTSPSGSISGRVLPQLFIDLNHDDAA